MIVQKTSVFPASRKTIFEMFKLFFEKTYIIIVPTYKKTLVHHHNMLHVFFW